MFRAANALAMIAGLGLLTLNSQALSEGSFTSILTSATQSLTEVNLDKQVQIKQASVTSYALDGLAQLSPMLNFDSKIIEPATLTVDPKIAVQPVKTRVYSPKCELQINRANPLGELPLYDQQRPDQNPILIASNKKT